MHVFVTGGAGFIGSHTVSALLNADHQVSVWDDMSTGKPENLETVIDRIALHRGDVRDLRALEECVRRLRPDAILHLAGITSVVRSIDDPSLSHSVNLTGTVNVLEAARRAGVPRVVLASSAAIYGDARRRPWCESMEARPSSPYGLQKWQAEEYARLYSELYAISSIALRYFNVYGPRQDPTGPYSGVICASSDRLRRRFAPIVFGDGRQTRDFIYVADVARANLLALTSHRGGHCPINIARGEEVSILRVLETLGRISGDPVEPEFQQARPGEVARSVGQVSQAESVLGFRADWSLEDGLRMTFGRSFS